jgi:nitroreductase
MISKEEILSALQFRHACKEFDTTKKIPEDEFNLILETAHLSPSSFGFEPWKFLVVQNPAKREALKQGAWGAPKKLDTASHFVVCLARKKSMKHDSEYIQHMLRDVQKLPEQNAIGKNGYYKAFQESDFDLTDDRKLFDWATKQTYIALANMMTIAALRGIDSCPIEGFIQKESDKVLKEHFGVDTEEYGIAYMVAFGYRVKDQTPKTRKPLNEIVQRFE